MAALAVHLAMMIVKEVFEFLCEACVRLLVVGYVCQDDVALRVQGDAVIGIGEVFRCEPEIERVLRHLLKGPSGRRDGGACA